MAKERPSKKKITAVIEDRLAPLFKVDNGGIEIVRYVRKGGRVEVRFLGAYRGSPCRETLAEQVVKPILKQVFYEVSTVEYLD